MAYFSASWCPACIEMERGVFTNPAVAASLQAAFVPVKIDHDAAPDLVRHYGVRNLPTTIILAPDGVPLDRMEGKAAAQQFAERLNRVVAQYQRPGAPPNGGMQAALAGQPSGPRPYPGPPHGGQPTSGPPLAGPSLAAQAPVGPYSPPSVGQGGYPFKAGPQVGPPPGAPMAGGSPGYVAGPAAAGGPPVGPPVAGAPGPVPPAPPYAAEVARTPTVQPNPPLALDGYCAVSLCDDLLVGQRRWVLGNRAHGVIHRDRTYLFANSEKAARFFQEPDRYAPVLSGEDVVLAVDEGRSAPGLREHGAFFGGRVYLFSAEETLQRFENNPNRYANAILRVSSRPMPRR